VAGSQRAGGRPWLSGVMACDQRGAGTRGLRPQHVMHHSGWWVGKVQTDSGALRNTRRRPGGCRGNAGPRQRQGTPKPHSPSFG